MNILDVALAGRIAASGGGGGGSGTDNYNDLSNLPQINGVTLAGDKTPESLGLQGELTFDTEPAEDSTNPVESGGVYSELAKKQDNLTFDGTYDASTNKAATESTVTNAINELDVSATSFDADETISSISETDGKVSVTKQDIAIASNQVVAMTGYAKPSSAPANPAIQTNDTANQAIGKLEFKADTNQTNILYACKRVGKNLFDITSPYFTRDTTVTPLDNGGATLSCSSAMWTQYFNTIPTEIGKEYKCVLYIDSISGVGSDEFIVSFKMVDPAGSTYAEFYNITTAGTHEATFTATVNTLCVTILLNNSATAKTSSANVRIMICEKNIYDIVGSDYERFSLPNYDLTQRQAEDRAALTEQVDEGAKNKFNPVNVVDLYNMTASDDGYTYQSSDTDTRTYFALSVDAYYNSTSIGNLGRLAVGQNGIVAITFTKLPTFNRLKIGHSGVNRTIAIFVNIPDLENNKQYTVTLNVTSYNPSVSLAWNHTMICTAEEWKVSQGFSEYALPNTDLTRLESEDRAALAEVVDSGAKNIVDISKAYASDYGNVSIDTNTNSVTASGTHAWAKGNIAVSVKPNTTYAIKYRISANTSTVQSSLTVTKGDTSDTYYSHIIAPGTIGSFTGEFTTDANASIAVVKITANSTGSEIATAASITISELMICTLADWKISPKFVPYRKNLDQLEATKAPALVLGSGVSSGSLDDVTKPTFDLYLDTVSNLPTTANYYVETSVWDSQSMIQRAYNVGNAESYIRVKSMNTWSAWKQITNT